MSASVEAQAKPRARWSDGYPVAQRDAIQRILDPILDNRVFAGAIFALILYSMYNLYQTYQAETPPQLEDLKRLSFIISTVFMIEFVLKLASRRLAYLRKEGVIDFLAASDFFSPAVRATKFVRFLRVLRILRVIRGVRMMHQTSRIEDAAFSSFSTATILVMLAFTTVKSYYDWQAARARVHKRLLPVLASVERNLAMDGDGAIVNSPNLGAAEETLIEHTDFIYARHTPPQAGAKPDWMLAIRRELDKERLLAVAEEIKRMVVLAAADQELSTAHATFVTDDIVAALKREPIFSVFARAKLDLYLRRQDVQEEKARDILGKVQDLLESVPVYVSRIDTDKIPAHFDKLHELYFDEAFLTVERQTRVGRMNYVFLIAEEWNNAREDEFYMLVATFALILVMMVVLNLAVKDVIVPLGEIRAQTRAMVTGGRRQPIALSRRPDNEIAEIVDNVNAILETKE